MPRREIARASVLALCAVASMVVPACSRLTFVRPDYTRGRETHVAPAVRIDPRETRRDTVFTLTQAAQARLVNGEHARALDAAERALRIDDSSAEAHSLAALSLDALGRAAQAGPHHRRAAELAPERGGLLNNYGIWLCSNGQAAGSLAWFERAATAPGYETPDVALANAAACALQSGRSTAARDYARRSLGISASNALALETLAGLEFAAGHGLQARAFIERRLAAAPADADVLLLASQIEQSLGDTAAAARYVQRIKAEFPRNSDAAGEGGQR